MAPVWLSSPASLWGGGVVDASGVIHHRKECFLHVFFSLRPLLRVSPKRLGKTVKMTKMNPHVSSTGLNNNKTGKFPADRSTVLFFGLTGFPPPPLQVQYIILYTSTCTSPPPPPSLSCVKTGVGYSGTPHSREHKASLERRLLRVNQNSRCFGTSSVLTGLRTRAPVVASTG